MAVHLLFEPLEHVEGVLLERAEETLRLGRVTGVVRMEGTLRGASVARFDVEIGNCCPGAPCVAAKSCEPLYWSQGTVEQRVPGDGKLC